MLIVMTLLFELHLKTKVSEIRKCVFRRLAQASTAHLEKSFRYILPFGIWAASSPPQITSHIASNVFRNVRSSPMGGSAICGITSTILSQIFSWQSLLWLCSGLGNEVDICSCDSAVAPPRLHTSLYLLTVLTMLKVVDSVDNIEDC